MDDPQHRRRRDVEPALRQPREQPARSGEFEGRPRVVRRQKSVARKDVDRRVRIEG